MLKKAKYLVLLPAIALVLGFGSFAISANPVVQVEQIPVAQAHNPTTVTVEVSCTEAKIDVGYADFSNGHYMETTITGVGDTPIVEKSDALQGNGVLHYSIPLSGDGPFHIVASAQAKYPNGNNEGSPVVGKGYHKEGCVEHLKVTLCHATASENNPYVKITVDVHSIANAQDLNGHGQHMDDIIPPFTWGEYSFPGRGDQSILASDCKVSKPTPTPTPSPTETPTPTPTATPTPEPTATPTPEPTATPTPAPTSTPTPAPSHTPKPTLPPTDATAAIPSGTSTPGLPALVGLTLAGFVGALLLSRRQRKATGK